VSKLGTFRVQHELLQFCPHLGAISVSGGLQACQSLADFGHLLLKAVHPGKCPRLELIHPLRKRVQSLRDSDEALQALEQALGRHQAPSDGTLNRSIADSTAASNRPSAA
jgi:hypothetical protein